jgi:hypothetical protein
MVMFMISLRKSRFCGVLRRLRQKRGVTPQKPRFYIYKTRRFAVRACQPVLWGGYGR